MSWCGGSSEARETFAALAQGAVRSVRGLRCLVPQANFSYTIGRSPPAARGADSAPEPVSDPDPAADYWRRMILPAVDRLKTTRS